MGWQALLHGKMNLNGFILNQTSHILLGKHLSAKNFVLNKNLRQPNILRPLQSFSLSPLTCLLLPHSSCQGVSWLLDPSQGVDEGGLASSCGAQNSQVDRAQVQ